MIKHEELIIIFFQNRRNKNVILYTFILNGVVFGLINMLSAILRIRDLANHYPYIIVFIWTIILASFLFFNLKILYFINLIPVCIFIWLRLRNLSFDVMSSDIEYADSWSPSWVWEQYALLGFLIVGIVAQVIVSIFSTATDD